MPNPSNHNFEWAYRFACLLAQHDITNVCISPGSRSTPLTLAFCHHPAFRIHTIVDERSSAFFALGLAKVTGKLAVLICTSGTATTNFFPAITEASYSHTPLLICTADRPPELHGTGANQTIDQQNLYGNKVRYFKDSGLPNPDSPDYSLLATITREALTRALNPPVGPVHLNFPFRKPLEPKSLDILQSLVKEQENALGASGVTEAITVSPSKYPQQDILTALQIVKRSKKGLIVVGPNESNPMFRKQLFRFAESTGFPIIADGIANLRFAQKISSNLITSGSSFLRSEIVRKQIAPDIIFRFGRMPTTNIISEFLAGCDSARQILVNSTGERFDDSGVVDTIIKGDPGGFLNSLGHEMTNHEIAQEQKSFLKSMQNIDSNTKSVIREALDAGDRMFEGRVIPETLEILPEDTPLFISSSMPVRDLDYYGFPVNKDILVYFNRGVSGIDGVTSTAMGMTAASEKPGVLIIGDLAFYHDLNGLMTGVQNQIPLTIVLINNHGGGIFNMLPISKFGATFRAQFITPHSLDFKSIVRGFGVPFTRIKSWDQFRSDLPLALNSKSPAVLEIRSDGASAMAERVRIWQQVVECVSKLF